MSAKKVRTERNIEDYQSLNDIAHVYVRPDTYVGSTKKIKNDTMIFDIENKKLIKKELNLPESVVRLFLEIISNAGDNCDSSRRANIDPDKFIINVDEQKISIKNFGLHIPVRKIVFDKESSSSTVRDYKEGDEDWCWLPVFMFGKLRTSSNYDANVINMGAGRNGFGAKLTNIFSKEFNVVIEDPKEHKRFKATWKDNMYKDSPDTPPEVVVEDDKTIKKGSVEISWILDFERFKITKYTQDHINLFARIAVDYSFTCKIPIIFNDVTFDYKSIRSYASLIWEEEDMKNNFVHYTWSKDAPESLIKALVKTQEKKILEAKKPEHIPELEIMVIDTPDKGQCISYVNGLMTVEDGVHVDAVQTPIFSYITKLVNETRKKSKKEGYGISNKNVKNHLSFIINARLPDPEYNSQSKTRLTSPSVSVKFDDAMLKITQNWDTINRLYAEMEALAFKSALNSDGKKKKHILMDKGEDANLAGTKYSKDCSIYFVEGNSAANYPQKRICMLEGGKNNHGYMSLKGVFPNTTNASAARYANNTVIASIKKILGLREGLDYTKEENIATLRYGFIILTVDADDDGMHIMALVLNFFREKFPGLLQKNMVGYLRTPIVKIFKNGKITQRFFNLSTFNAWMEKNSTKGVTVRYYKGLGTSSDDDIRDDLKYSPTVVCFYDSKCVENFNIAFHGENADLRKSWIEKWRDVTQVEDIISVDIDSIKGQVDLMQAQDISQFINRELVAYSVASLFRAIPSEYDHLKDSQRKALYSALVFFNYDPKKGKSIKVGRFSNKAADMTQYHHGEKSLTDTFIKMAQDFIGSNNMGYFKKDGQFGSRACGGDNAADARYSETHLSWWIPYVYQKESIDLVPKRVTDDEECEPLWLPGVIPMGIVNGTNGIATAFSTATPGHNPLDVIDWYRKKCKGEEPDSINPWYNKFTGNMKIVDRDSKEYIDIDGYDELLPGDLDNETMVSSPKRISTLQNKDNMDKENLAIFSHSIKSKLTLKTYGKYCVKKFHKHDGGGPILTVTELPIKTWIHKYRKWLEYLVQQKGKDRLVYDFKDNSTTEKPVFEIHWNAKAKTPNLQNLRLIRSFGLSNITLIDHRGFPSRFENVNEVMEKYYVHMIEHYGDVRNNRIKKEELRVKDLTYKIKFISNVLNGTIVLLKVSEEVIKAKMEELQIPFDYYDKSKSRDFSKESLERYKNHIAEAQARLKIAEETSAQKIWLDKLDALEVELRKRYRGKSFNMKT